MRHDAQGLAVTAGCDAAVSALDAAIDGYLTYRADTPERLARLLAADPEFGLAHCLKGYLAMSAFNAAQRGVARAAAEAAGRLSEHACPREQAHAAALGAWCAGDPARAVRIWEDILAEHKRDILAFRLAHFVNFWRGEPAQMLASVERVTPHWAEDVPGFVSVLGCLCFAAEECGLYGPAEQAGREAIARDPGDLWAAHGVAHVLEMQGRRAEGLDWIAARASGWAGANNLTHHLWWHAAMFHLEQRDFEAVLDLYDACIRNLASPLVQASPDLYIDVQNAASMLFRLGRHGVDVGDRWDELALKAEARIGDTLSGFTLPHWMMALAATGRFEAAELLLDAALAAPDRTIREIAAPVCAAALAHGRGEYAPAVAAMRPVLGEMYRLGGSHAQQDVLEQLYLDAAIKAELPSDVRLLLERVAGRHPLSPARRIGYAMAADRAS